MKYGGALGPLEVSQATLLVASLIVMIPASMIVLSLVLPAGVNRLLNLVLAVLYTLVNIGNLVSYHLPLCTKSSNGLRPRLREGERTSFLAG